MIIKKIILENIGPYVNTNIIDLSVTNSKNIILIGGKNGSGKTTLLKSIKYGLFGAFALGYKSDSKKYYDEIINLINTEKNRKHFSIQLFVDIIEDGDVNEYLIKREWNLEKNSIEEEVVVIKGDFMLDKYSTLEFFEKLKSFTSPQLINSIIFDGEKIGNIIQNDQTEEFLQETFESIFNINMLNQLTNDLVIYLERKTTENISTKEVYSYSLLSEANSLKKDMKLLDSEIALLKSKVNELLYKKKDLQKEFNSLGGLSKNKIKMLIDEMNHISKESENKNKTFKYIIENDCCFILNLNLLKQGFNQVIDELPLVYLTQVLNIEKYLKKDNTELSKSLKLLIKDNTKLIHDVGEVDEEKLKNIYETYKKKLSFVKHYIDTKDKEVERISLFKNQIDTQEQIERFEKIILEIERIDEMINIMQIDISQKDKKLKEISEKFNKTYNSLNHINNEIRKSSTYDNSFVNASKTLDINNCFIQHLKKTKLKEVSNVATNIFNETIRKDNYISKININDNYSISIYDRFGEIMKLKTLSAGEMQLLVSSIVWAMFKVSGRKETFVFDTPLARLDIDNRLSFINNIIKTISDQVIILSTDSEFIGQNYDTIVLNTAKQYRLDYLNEKKVTKIVKGYFG